MALPPQRLLNDDLFIVNRITANDVDTYKINADDIGVFLLEAPRPPGSNPEDKFVNDGDLNVYGEIPGSSETFKNLHSANEYCEGKLVFKDGFIVTGAQHDVRIEPDFDFLASSLACAGLDGSGVCLKLDMSWLSENIICHGTGSGLESLGDCIQINLCEHSGLNINPSDGCLEVSLCPSKGIVHSSLDGCLELDLGYLSNNLSCDGLRPSGGNTNSLCMEIDMDWLSANFRCGDVNDSSAQNGSGLIDGGGCIEVDPCWVSDKWNLGNNNPTLSPGDTNSIDVQSCRIAINHDWLLQWAKDNIQDIQVDGLCITRSANGNLFKGEVTINQDVPCIREYVCDNNSTITFKQNSTEVVNYTPCQNNDKTLTAYKLTIKQKDEDGNTTELGVFEPFSANKTITVEPGGSSSGGTVNWSEIQGKPGCLDTICNTPTPPGTGGMTCDEVLECIEEPDCIKQKKLYANTGVFMKNKNAGRPTITIGTGDRDVLDTDKKWTGRYVGITGAVKTMEEDAGDGNGTFIFNTGENDDGTCGGAPKPGNEDTTLILEMSRTKFKIPGVQTGATGSPNLKHTNGKELVKFTTFINKQSESLVVTASDSTEVASFDVDNIIDSLTGGAGTTTTSLDGGIFQFAYHKANYERNLVGTVPYYPSFPAPNVFVDDLAAIHPSLVYWDWSEDSFEHSVDEYGQTTTKLKDDESERVPVPSDPNQAALSILALSAIGIQKRRIEALTAELAAKTSRETMLSTLGITEYTNETAAANSGLGQGEVYWDTSLNRMRAVT